MCVDAAVHFDECSGVLFSDHQTQFTDLFVCALDELLPTKAWVDRHEEHQIQVSEDVFQHADGRMRVEYHAGMDAEGFDLLHSTVDVFAGLVVEGDDVGASLGEGLEVFLGFHNHQVDIQWLLGFLLDGLHHGDAEGDVGHKAAVHHVAVEPVGLAAVDHLDVGFQVEEVGGEKGRGYQVHGYRLFSCSVVQLFSCRAVNRWQLNIFANIFIICLCRTKDVKKNNSSLSVCYGCLVSYLLRTKQVTGLEDIR